MASAFKILYSLDEAIDLSSIRSIWKRNRLEVSLWLRLNLDGLTKGYYDSMLSYSQKSCSQICETIRQYQSVNSQIVFMT